MKGDFERSDKCDIEFSKISQCFGMQEALEEAAIDNDRTMFPAAKKPTYAASFNATNDTVAHQIHSTDPSKTIRVSASLPQAQESALVEFLCENLAIFA